MKLKEYREKMDALIAKYQLAHASVEKETEALQKARKLVVSCEEAQKIAQAVAQTVQQQAHTKIASVVSRCLEAVFDEPYEFKILFEQKRGRTEARLVFMKDSYTFDPMDGSGGGVIDVASFALRLACMMLTKPPVRRLLIMDEPFKFVSAEYEERVRIMLEKLAEELQVQFIFVTHKTELQTGTIIQL